MVTVSVAPIAAETAAPIAAKTVTGGGIPVRYLAPGEMLAEIEAELRQYEIRYEMSSEKMATLLELDAIAPTAEVLKWYASYHGAKSLRAKTPMTGTAGTTTKASTKAG